MLDRFEQLLRKRIAESDIPFLGLHESVFTENMQFYVQRVVKNAPSIRSYVIYLEWWPALFSIYLTMHVIKGFGERGHFEVYAHIESALGGIALSTHEKESLWAAFRHACIQLGLEVSQLKSGAHFMVDEYLRHVGVPLAYVADGDTCMWSITLHSGGHPCLSGDHSSDESLPFCQREANQAIRCAQRRPPPPDHQGARRPNVSQEHSAIC